MPIAEKVAAAARKLGLRLGVGAGRWAANEAYVDAAPSAQQTIDLFKDDWASRLPIPGTTSGEAGLFEDARIRWLLERCPVNGFDILELGPLEAGHTKMLADAGAASILAVEGNKSAYLKCLVVQQLLDLKQAKFELGDFDAWLETADHRFDLVLASGVLYHLADPLATLLDLTRVADRIFIWSHFADADAMPADDKRRRPFTGETRIAERDGERLTYHVRSYLGTQTRSNFCGGRESSAVWMESAEVVALLERRGYRVETGVAQPDHPSGPALCLYATRA